MLSKKQRIVVDTNIWISFLLSGNFSRIDKYVEQGLIEFQYSRELLQEFLEVSARPKFHSSISKGDISRLLQRLQSCSALIEVISSINLCRDTKDNFLLSLSKDSNADFLITGDDDLLSIGNFEMTRIVSLTEFLKILSSYE